MAVDKLVDSAQLDSDLEDVADAIRAKSGGSSPLAFPAGFVSEIGSIQTGGGGAQVVASGTIQGNGAYKIDIPVGTKMPECDFEFCLYAPANTEFGYYDNNHAAAAWTTFNIPKSILKFDLSGSGQITLQSTSGYTINNDGTIVTPTALNYYLNILGVKGAGFYTLTSTLGQYSYINKSASGFVVHLNINAWQITFKSEITYNWYVKYYGTDPSTDIVEVA